ncbi:MAG TPA: hypothetical protein VIO16_06930 [Dehalococcoidia bacterium]
MGDPVPVITAITALIVAVGALMLNFFKQRSQERAEIAAERAATLAAESKAEIIATKKGIFELGKQIDGRMEDLLEAVRKAARAEGVSAGEQSERDRHAPSDRDK